MVVKRTKRRWIPFNQRGPYSLKPQPGISNLADDGWYYVSTGGLDICTHVPSVGTAIVRMTRKQLADLKLAIAATVPVRLEWQQ